MTCNILAEDLGFEDVTHCQLCHPDVLISVFLLDGEEVGVCGPMAIKLVEQGLLAKKELKRFCCVPDYVKH